jgi:hypothetical protein
MAKYYVILSEQSEGVVMEFENDTDAILSTVKVMEYAWSDDLWRNKWTQNTYAYIDKLNDDGSDLEENWAYLTTEYDSKHDCYKYFVETEERRRIWILCDQWTTTYRLDGKCYQRKHDDHYEQVADNVESTGLPEPANEDIWRAVQHVINDTPWRYEQVAIEYSPDGACIHHKFNGQDAVINAYGEIKL